MAQAKVVMEKHVARFFAALFLFFAAVALLSYFRYYFSGLPLGYAAIVDFAVALIAGLAIIYVLSEGMIYYGIKMHIEKDMAAVVHMFQLFAYAVLVIVLLYTIHINITGLLIGAGFLGIVVGLAAQNTLGSVMAGLAILSARPFSVGDKVTISTWQYGTLPATYPHDFMLSGISGVVVKLGLIYTEILRDDGTPALVPNAIMSQALILNHKKVDARLVKVRVELDIKKSAEEFEKRLLAEVKKEKGFDGSVNVSITDINTSSYGISVTTLSKKEHEEKARETLARLALKVASRMQMR